ncbi:hypothetical protein Kpol_487p11 [Vanderwaltozyma polyspora DSM 70294]|uniref:EF-hand domain-containing protein n=1 Tax=Vanderwaltozyma polyspora (strain ATCC 22028 / DSM 70294 / BCRC 21397 / CBS 2163 / NBRC 10782 / NRRL Y-8283 / UCD 57-17) TaxID=436907 RepID=A7TQ86_VANPO|nr:uncharacterized protein Kpol_487p11 [Vanderwaltozyma polyspora DSM 70294]EDO15578.1 hypothetical protein Kpol_487p11 [Vanderwaltozyma polyspora DSM 70294]
MKLSSCFLFSLILPSQYIFTSAEAANAGSTVNVEVERPPEGLSWEEWHMQHEHQMNKYDPETFFALHDTKKKGYFDDSDILGLYGLNRGEVVGNGDGMGDHDNSESIDEELAKRVVKFIKKLIDVNDDSKITKEEYLSFAKRGNKLPDLGVGVGHHADFELEYELHHWNKYHKDSDPDVKNVHKADIEHELLHHMHEIEHEEKVQRGSSRGTVITDDELESRIDLKNIPNKFKNGFF